VAWLRVSRYPEGTYMYNIDANHGCQDRDIDREIVRSRSPPSFHRVRSNWGMDKKVEGATEAGDEGGVDEAIEGGHVASMTKLGLLNDWAYSFLNSGFLIMILFCFEHGILKTIFCLKRDS